MDEEDLKVEIEDEEDSPFESEESRTRGELHQTRAMNEKPVTTERGYRPRTRGGYLDAPPPRDGYKQRWIRIKVGGLDDPRRFSQAKRMGWEPRLISTVPENDYWESAKHKHYDNIIALDDLVLMERPVALHREYAKEIRKLNETQQTAAESNLMRSHVVGSGMGRPEVTQSTRVRLGRPTESLLDED